MFNFQPEREKQPMKKIITTQFLSVMDWFSQGMISDEILSFLNFQSWSCSSEFNETGALLIQI